METIVLKIGSKESEALLHKFIATLPDVQIMESVEINYMSEPLQLHEDKESSWEEVRDVFKTTTGDKPWMAGEVLNKSEIKKLINESLQQASNSQMVSIKEVQKNIQELKATHTHGS